MSHKNSCNKIPNIFGTLARGTRRRHDSFQHKYDTSENDIKLHGDHAPIYVLCNNTGERTKVEK